MGSQLKRLTMNNEVKNLFEKGLRISQIIRNTGLDRKTVRKYLQMNSQVNLQGKNGLIKKPMRLIVDSAS